MANATIYKPGRHTLFPRTSDMERDVEAGENHIFLSILKEHQKFIISETFIILSMVNFLKQLNQQNSEACYLKTCRLVQKVGLWWERM